MIDLLYSLIIEATEDPDYFGFYSSFINKPNFPCRKVE